MDEHNWTERSRRLHRLADTEDKAWKDTEIDRLRAEVEKLRAALMEVAEGAGPFSRDRLTHATNTIRAMQATAESALAAERAGEGADRSPSPVA